MSLAPLDRRTFLRWSALVPAVAAVPAVLGVPAWAEETTAFVDTYRTNVPANHTPETNAAVRILSGMQRIWRTGSTWDSGVVLDAAVLRANVRHCVAVTRHRTDAEAERAFVYDRQHQSYAAIGGLGPLADLYRSGAKAVTGITTAPDGTPPAKIDDAVPPNAPAGSALGAGSHDSELGLVATLVDTVRGNFASGNPSKAAYQYPRPWRLTADSRVEDTGRTDALGFPVYRSDVVVAPQLLRQRSTNPADDGGFPSGHTNAFHLACLALAYAVPERFQELVARAYDLADTRIVAGMHSPVDVIGGRTLATALTAATLADPENAALKTAAREQALKYFTAKTGTTADTLFARAHTGADEYGDRRANAAMVARRATYGLPDRDTRVAMRVPKGAEVLLETRLPYLDAAQRREVLRTTAFPAGNPLLDGPELWGRLNLFAAADGYGAFDTGVRVTMDATRGGFAADDSWRNDIGGAGGLVKAGTGTLTLAGANSYRGGTRVEAGTLVAATPGALGTGDVELAGGVLRASGLRAGGYHQTGGTLSVAAGAALLVRGEATLERGALELRVTGSCPAHEVDVLCARRLRGRFSAIRVDRPGYRVVPRYTSTGLSVRILREFS
ncbi:phosphatase PAP2 family protein [Amycolatopsis sp. DG1A-15b]|uniref:phosphatase PAP2 family protein n=1 Tax=Amycolatopsis sp. DG1A-15b TaxID=3052846 RepID=UPI00255BC687|nr:phosphatase PAP2 family protein [Amycolatopsis sp. DG1A-15b]WIX89103.1 autotransporter-associated beta strand repeat-containing protein [Amycolatopsis sp. DG1A-15b]